jgi:hypothetical protein
MPAFGHTSTAFSFPVVPGRNINSFLKHVSIVAHMVSSLVSIDFIRGFL